MEQKKQAFLLDQDYMDAILENFQDGIYVTDNEANTVYLNHSYERISGLRGTDMLGKNMRDLVAGGVVSASGTLSVLENGESVTIEQSFRTGKRAVITSSPVFADPEKQDHIIMVVTIVREITEIHSIRKEVQRLTQQNRELFNEVRRLRNERNGNIEMVAKDSVSVRTMHLAERVAMLDHPVLITGEEGVGKEKMARFIHGQSSRNRFPFMRIEFSVIPKENPMGYLFGYEDPETNEYHMGILENADGGTVFIEEIRNIPSYAQGKMLALLRSGSCVMGDGVMRQLNVRFVVGSTCSFEELQENSSVSQEILQCFSMMPIAIAPLRERRDDIIPLLDYFLARHNNVTGEKKYFSKSCYRRLYAYSWPGNVREMYNLTQRAAIISMEDEIREEDLMLDLRRDTAVEMIKSDSENEDAFPVFTPYAEYIDLRTEVSRLEAYYMTEAFQKHGNIRAAAETLGMDSSTFVRKRQRYAKMGLMDK